MTAETVALTTQAVAGLCHWMQNLAGCAEGITHAAFHFGSPCPYAVVAAVLAGRPDPRDDIAQWRLDLTIALTAKGTPPLSLNDRSMHWAAHATAVDRLKARTRNAARAVDVPHLDQVHVQLFYRPKDRRQRDADNLVATLKPCIDALHQHDKADPDWLPIVDGDTARHVTWSPPHLVTPSADKTPAMWLVLQSFTATAINTGPAAVALNTEDTSEAFDVATAGTAIDVRGTS